MATKKTTRPESVMERVARLKAEELGGFQGQRGMSDAVRVTCTTSDGEVLDSFLCSKADAKKMGFQPGGR